MPGTSSPAATGRRPGCAARSSARQLGDQADDRLGRVRSPSSGVGVRRSPSTRPSASTIADLVSVPPTSKASTTSPGPRGAGAASGVVGHGRQPPRMTERVRLRGLVGVEAPGQCPGEGHALGAHEFGHRVERAGLEAGAGGGDLVGEPGGRFAEVPGDPARRRDRDRAVPVLHRGVRLGPRLRGLAHLERRLVGEADGPAAAEERELLGVDERGVELLGDRGPGVGDRPVEVLAERGAEEGQRGGREAGLHDRLLVGERQGHRVVDEVDERRGRVADDADRAHAPPQLARRGRAPRWWCPSGSARPRRRSRGRRRPRMPRTRRSRHDRPPRAATRTTAR